MKFNPYFAPCRKINSKWFRDLTLQTKASRRKHRRKSLRPQVGNGFLDTAPKAQSITEQIDTLDIIKIKACSLKDSGKRMKRDATYWEKFFAKHIPD